MQFKFSDGLELRKHWSLDSQMHFLNHGSFGAVPIVVQQAQQRLRERMEQQPVDFLVRETPPMIRASAQRMAQFLGASGDDLAFVENATAAANAVLRSYPWQAGDELLLSAHAYPAIKNLARYVARQFDIIVREFQFSFPLQGKAEMLSAFRQGINSKTRIALIDHISSPLAIIYPVEGMLQICREHGVKTLVDGAHVPGMLPLHIESLGADWYTGNCHKWLFAPRGCAFLWASKQSRDFLQPAVVSSLAGDSFPLNFDWVGTRDITAWLSIDAALDFYEEMGGKGIPAHLHGFVIEMAQRLADRWQVSLPASTADYGAMVTLPVPIGGEPSQEHANQIRDRFWREYRIEVPLFALEDRLWVRISAQLYNVPADYEALAEAMLALAGRSI